MAVLVFQAVAAVPAQGAGKVHRIGFLTEGGARAFEHRLAAFRDGLRDRGYVEGRNFVFDARYGEARPDRVRDIAGELVRQRPDVIVTHGGYIAMAADREAKKIGQSIPIVFAVDANPVVKGVVASLAKPGGNITGLTDNHGGLVSKRLQIFKEIDPSIGRVAVLMDPDRAAHASQLLALRTAATTLGITIIPVPFQNAGDYPRVVREISRLRPDALMHFGYALIASHRKKIAEMGLSLRLPILGTIRPSAMAGFLASYGTSLRAMYRRAPTYVDKILKGAKRADLPVEQPTKFNLVINLKTAKALGITVPRSILLRANEVIE